ncbi:complement component C1q receptor [Xenentodon cancila]
MSRHECYLQTHASRSLATNGQPYIGFIFSQGVSGSANLLIYSPIMLLILLLQLINGFERLSGAEHETLCTSNACFTLHMERISFDQAQQGCEDNGGYLMTVRDTHEEDELRSLFSLIQRQHHDKVAKFWIGLKLHKKDCVLEEKTLRGFKWVSGEADSNYSNWKKEPTSTCTQERCVKVDYTFSEQDQLKWTAGACRSLASYACKFYINGMCKPLRLLGAGKITYTPPFAKEPQKITRGSLPVGTYANVLCSDQTSHYSVCMSLSSNYNWTNPGPFCEFAEQNCEINNGGCEHSCHQEASDVRCLCKEGYELEGDGLSCKMKDVCGPDTCEHQCTMGRTGFSCKCPDGFELDENQRNCSDTDECQSQPCEGHLCVNTHGSYVCLCKGGYEMVDGECIDVDECAQSRCEHGCLNTAGSFSCYCYEGFTLWRDGLSCEDVNECVHERCLAELVCINTSGSFMCTYEPENDGSTRAPYISITPTPPSDDPLDEKTQDYSAETLTRSTVELQHQSPHTDVLLPDLMNMTNINASSVTNMAHTVNSRVIICVLGSVIPLLLLIMVTLFIAIFRCSRSKKEVKKTTTADGYCWVSSGLDPRLEKLYESILTDDL